MEKKIWILCTVVVLLLAPFSAPGWGSSEKSPVKIGGLFDLTGPMTPIGVSARQGAVVALEEAGFQVEGRKIEFIVEDAASDPSVAMDKVRKLVEVDKVVAVIGPALDPSVIAVSGYCNKMKVPHLATVPNSVTLILDNDWTWMPVMPSSTFTYFIGKWVGRHSPYKNLTALTFDVEAGHQFVEGVVTGLVEEGGKVLQKQAFPFGTMDFSPYFVRLDKKAEAFLIWAPDIFTQPLYTQLKEFGVKLPLIAPEGGGITADPDGLLQKMGPVVQGIKLGQFWSPYFDDPLSKKYVKAFRAKWGRTPDWGTSNGYVDVQILLEAIRGSGGDTSSKALSKSLDKVSIDTIRGPISFTPDHVAVHELYITEVVKSGDRYVEKPIKTYTARADVVAGKFKITLTD